MTDIIFEIAKQLTFEASFKLKLLIKLLNKRLFGYIKLHKFPYKHRLLNDERIDLFPDLKELDYQIIKNDDKNYIFPFSCVKIKRLQLESLTINECSNDFTWVLNWRMFCDRFDLNILRDISSLQKLKFYYDKYIEQKYIDILYNIDVKYIVINSYLIDEYSYREFKGNNYKYIKIHDEPFYLYGNIPKSLQHICIQNIYGDIKNYDKLNELKLYSLKIYINQCDNYYDENNNIINPMDFSKLYSHKIHDLTLYFNNKCDINITIKFIQQFKLNKLTIVNYTFMYQPFRIPINIIINHNIKILKLIQCGFYMDEELNTLKENGVFVYIEPHVAEID